MDESQVENLLRTLKCFVGVFARDELPLKIRKRPAALVVNTDPRKKPGTHWVAFYLRDKTTIEYFDPYGLPPKYKAYKNFIANNSIKWFYNEIQFQPTIPLSMACGLFCSLFIRLRCSGLSFNDYIKLFSKDKSNNDMLVKVYTQMAKHGRKHNRKKG